MQPWQLIIHLVCVLLHHVFRNREEIDTSYLVKTMISEMIAEVTKEVTKEAEEGEDKEGLDKVTGTTGLYIVLASSTSRNKNDRAVV